MSMYIVNVAIRWKTGELEGFGSSGLTEASARARALAKASEKASCFPPALNTYEVLSSAQYAALSVDEQEILQVDWDGSSL